MSFWFRADALYKRGISFLRSILDQVGIKNMSDETIKQKFRLMILGFTYTGKTTFINFWQDGTKFPDRTIGYEEIDLESTQEDSEMFIPYDISGEPAAMETYWADKFKETRPTGIIFMISHEQPDQNLAAFKYTVDFIIRNRCYLGRTSLVSDVIGGVRDLKAVMILVNKSDQWRHDEQTYVRLIRPFEEDMQRLKEVNIQCFSMRCSLWDDPDSVRRATKEFLTRLAKG